MLGRLIETLADKSYEEYVKERVLAPLGITRTRIGKTRLEGRRPGEVRYYAPDRAPSVFAADLGERVPRPYGAWYLEAMDSHGGWISSVVDLARFACAFDDPDNCRVLNPKSIEEMFARPTGMAGHDEKGQPKDVYYSLGWMNRVGGEGKVSHWHTGSLGGTAALLVRRHDGRNWVLLFNARVSRHVSHLARAVDPLVHLAANAVEEWPDVDLFAE